MQNAKKDMRLSFFFLIIRGPPSSTPFPSTPLFRSPPAGGRVGHRQEPGFFLRGSSSRRCTNCSSSRIPAMERFSSSRRSEEHTSELQSQSNLVCRLLLEKKKTPRVTTNQLKCNHAA